MACSTQEHLHLQILPTELLVYILSSLDCPTLLACTQVSYHIARCRLHSRMCWQVCRLFNCLIACTASLQLTIELYAAGQEKGPSNPECRPTDQLDALKKRETAWDELKWSKEERIPFLNGGLWELYGGVLAQNNSPGAITFRRLPSIYRSIEEAEWTIDGFDYPVRDFGMDPAQDLLVVVESPRWLAHDC